MRGLTLTLTLVRRRTWACPLSSASPRRRPSPNPSPSPNPNPNPNPNLGQAGRGPAPPLQKRAENSPEDACREMEKEVNSLIEESSLLSLKREHGPALEKAKEVTLTLDPTLAQP